MSVPSPSPRVSAVVPVLQEESTIERVLDHLAAQPQVDEIVVVDGGSSDRTVELARRHPVGARVLRSSPGRARQQNAGARAASGRIVLFIHADTRLPPGGAAGLARVAGSADVAGGNFAVRFDGPGLFPRALGATYAVQRALGVFYGDSAIFCRRRWFLERGGFPEIEIMEDYELARAIVGTGASRRLPGPAITSSRRWRAAGIPRTVASWVVIRWLFIAGVSPARLARLYAIIR
ncbi:MAG: TIGR04283 family arsenosugar biosynthesis glycosyltransferase [Miltoncostaeaceae bacterium]